MIIILALSFKPTRNIKYCMFLLNEDNARYKYRHINALMWSDSNQTKCTHKCRYHPNVLVSQLWFLSTQTHLQQLRVHLLTSLQYVSLTPFYHHQVENIEHKWKSMLWKRHFFLFLGLSFHKMCHGRIICNFNVGTFWDIFYALLVKIITRLSF